MPEPAAAEPAATTAPAATPEPAAPVFRIAQYFVSDPDYPRNRRIRDYLEALPGVEVTVHRRSTNRFRFVRLVADATAPLRTIGRYDAAFVAEYAITFAVFHTVAGRMRGVPVVVDGFVGKVETLVEDWHRHGASSPMGLLLRVVDRLAVTTSDLYLTDTDLRARAVATRYGQRHRVLSLPVGAPAWATASPPRSSEGPLRVLFYGLFVPLHGVDTIIEALSRLEQTAPGTVTLTLVGDGVLRPDAERLAHSLDLDAVCRFRPSVQEEALASIIDSHDVVLGVFGESSQAATVIPNKVWQGLACGRTVVTRSSGALDEIAPIVGDRLVTVPPGDARALTAALTRIAAARADAVDPAPTPPTEAANIAGMLAASVADRFRALGTFLVEHGLGLTTEA